jgi:hypothetical protein
MKQFYQAKFKELFIEFNSYLIEHPEFATHIPKDTHIILLDYQDPRYSAEAIKLAQKSRDTDELQDRPIVYIEVREMVPVKSRLRKVEVLTSPPEYVIP